MAPFIIILLCNRLIIQPVHAIEASFNNPMIILNIRQEIIVIILFLFTLSFYLPYSYIITFSPWLLPASCLCHSIKHCLFIFQWYHTCFSFRGITFFCWLWVHNVAVIQLKLIFDVTPVQDVHHVLLELLWFMLCYQLFIVLSFDVLVSVI